MNLNPSFEPLDPEDRARENRKLMMRIEHGEREYFLAKLEGQEREVIDDCFRLRDYIKGRDDSSSYMEEWRKASLREVWSPKFLGLDDYGIQRLEFQNPPYVAACRMGGDPRKFNRTFTVQVNGCTYECSFCYVPREKNSPALANGKYFTVKDIFDTFLRTRRERLREDGIDTKVVRLSGGEVPSIVPELILDTYREIEERGLSKEVYLWVDCNLSTTKYIKQVEGELKDIAKKKNFGMVGCIKSVGDGETGKENFTLITKAKPEFFEKQFEVLDYFVNKIKADFYVYLVPLVAGSKDEVRERLLLFVRRLRDISRNLPLRTNIIQIQRYGPALENVKSAAAEGRCLPWYDERTVFKLWYHEVLPRFYSSSDILRYRCQIPLHSSTS